MHRVHLRVQGRVQGVGFRYFVLRRAQELGVTGWVQNLSSGDVEVEAEGTHDALRRLIERVHEGPAAARVDRVFEQWSEGPRLHDRFTTGPSR